MDVLSGQILTFPKGTLVYTDQGFLEFFVIVTGRNVDAAYPTIKATGSEQFRIYGHLIPLSHIRPLRSFVVHYHMILSRISITL